MKKQVIIIGAGPGGLQLAYYLQKSNIDYVVIERGDIPGHTFKKFPIHRTLISINKVYTGFEDEEVNMRFDWNSLLSDDHGVLFSQFTKEYFPHSDVLLEYFAKYAETYNLNVKYNTEVELVSKENDTFQLKTTDGMYECEQLVVATGLEKPFIPKIENIELCTNYVDLDLNYEKYAQKRVLIFGKANSAFETADSLIPYASMIHCSSPNPLKMAWETHYVGNLRAINNNFLDTYQLKSQNGVLNAEATKIEKRDGKFYVTFAYGNANGEVEEIMYDEVIVCTGFKFDNTIFHEDILPELSIKDKFPSQKSNWESTNVNNLYFAGTITQVRDYKKSTSGFIHGFRYNSKCLSHILEEKILGKKWPSYEQNYIASDEISDKIIEIVNRSSSIWQQTGFIGSVLVIDEANNSWKLIYDMPVDYVKDNQEKFGNRYFAITLEYGHELFEKAESVFNVERVNKHDVDNAHLSPGLHPILRQYVNGELVSTYHMIEDFESQWNDEVRHVIPLKEYMKKQLEAIEASTVEMS